MDNNGAISRFRRLFASSTRMGQLGPFAMNTQCGAQRLKNSYGEDLFDDKLLDFTVSDNGMLPWPMPQIRRSGTNAKTSQPNTSAVPNGYVQLVFEAITWIREHCQKRRVCSQPTKYPSRSIGLCSC
jgi:hypothetical protein